MRARLIVGAGVIVVAAIGAVAWALTWRATIAPVPPPAAGSFSNDLVNRGQDLALIGDCNVCHTNPGGAAFAGGRALPTPFGTIYSSNITPDPQTGIGNWSQAAFVRAMREGVSRSGTFIYPAHPYDHFTRLTDADLEALYAYVMTRAPVAAPTPAPALSFPFNQRPLLAGWNLLFLQPGPDPYDPTRSEEWNRGAYLAQGIGHCGACHTPRNLFGAEEKDQPLAGGMAEGWYAPGLDKTSPALVQWTQASLFAYLRNGRDPQHGIAGGPMADVVRDLSAAPEDDVQAIATYIVSLMGPERSDRSLRARNLIAKTERDTLARRQAAGREGSPGLGEIIYVASCAQCHEPWATYPPQNAGRNLALQTAVVAPDPANFIYTILAGIDSSDDPSRTIMPEFAGVLTDPQIADLARYVRRTFSDQPAWNDLEPKIRAARASLASQGSLQHATRSQVSRSN
jgi:mono/diheme cytochrome c family protein